MHVVNNAMRDLIFIGSFSLIDIYVISNDWNMDTNIFEYNVQYYEIQTDWNMDTIKRAQYYMLNNSFSIGYTSQI